MRHTGGGENFRRPPPPPTFFNGTALNFSMFCEISLSAILFCFSNAFDDISAPQFFKSMDNQKWSMDQGEITFALPMKHGFKF